MQVQNNYVPYADDIHQPETDMGYTYNSNDQQQTGQQTGAFGGRGSYANQHENSNNDDIQS